MGYIVHKLDTPNVIDGHKLLKYHAGLCRGHLPTSDSNFKLYEVFKQGGQ